MEGTCSGHGRCVTLRESGMMRKPEPAVYEAWDADRIQGCMCDEGWTNHDCSERMCPMGADPLAQGQTEVQQLTTAMPYIPEIQTLTLSTTETTNTPGGGGGADIDEVQQVDIIGNNNMPTGDFTITMDCRTTTFNKCALWPDSRRLLLTTAPITLDTVDATVTAARVQAALESLSMIGTGQLTVTASIVTGVVGVAAYTHRIMVTFSGALVAGDVATLSVFTGNLNVVAGVATTLTTTVQQGSELIGTVDLTWDIANTVPSLAQMTAANCADATDTAAMFANGAQTALGVALTGTEAAMKAAITTIVFAAVETPPTNAITVTKVPNHGPGLVVKVTFGAGVRARGDVGLLATANIVAGFLPVSLAPATTTGTTATIASAELVKGSFIQGNLGLKIWFPVDMAGTLSSTTITPPAPWCASAAYIRSMLNAKESQYGYGMVDVSRVRAPNVGVGLGTAAPWTDAWTGGYTWTITFRGMYEDVPAIEGDSSTLLDAAGTAGVATFTNTEVRAGGPTAEISEVQVVDCTCAACNNVATQYIKLAWGREVTDPIPYSADGTAIRNALANIPGLQDVIVNQHDSSLAAAATNLPLCSSSGTSTAITFAWNGGQQPPLRIAGKPLTDGNTLPASALVTFHYSRGWGLWGGRAKKGTRKMLPCSGRGRCDANTGMCSCFANWDHGDNGLPPETASVATTTFNPTAPGPIVMPGGPSTTVPYAQAVRDALLNCGHPTAVGGYAGIIDCPNNDANTPYCTGKGTCSNAPEYKCTCQAGSSGSACEVRDCPQGPGWFNHPVPNDPLDNGKVELGPGGTDLSFTALSGHVTAPCSRAGRCGWDSGNCMCRSGWGGIGCQLIICPGQKGDPGTSVNETCMNGGRCVSLQQIGQIFPLDKDTGALVGPGWVDPNGSGSEIYNTPWDSFGLMRGCVCEAVPAIYLGPFAFNWASWTGYSCAQLTCPGGPDPEDPRAFDTIDDDWEIQSVNCTLNYDNAIKGRISYGWRNNTGPAGTRLDAYVYDLDRPGNPLLQDRITFEGALQRVPALLPFEISVFSSSTTPPKMCDPSGQTVLHVKFVGHPGDHPLLDIVPDAIALAGGGSITVQEVRKGKGQYYECNRRGTCNRNTGRCACMPGFESSDGQGGRGQLGDCGYYKAAVQPAQSELGT